MEAVWTPSALISPGQASFLAEKSLCHRESQGSESTASLRAAGTKPVMGDRIFALDLS